MRQRRGAVDGQATCRAAAAAAATHRAVAGHRRLGHVRLLQVTAARSQVCSQVDQSLADTR